MDSGERSFDQSMAINLNVPDAAQDETLADYLKRRERELIQQTAAIRGLLAPKEQELATVRQAMQAIGVQQSYVDQLQPFLDQASDQPPPPTHGLLNSTEARPAPGILNSPAAGFPWEALTIKDMILNALKDHFHSGATPSELSEYMKTAYGRDVDRNSIGPQLARLRDERLVESGSGNALISGALIPGSGKWRLSLRGDLADAAAEIEKRNVNALNSDRSPEPGSNSRGFRRI
jgi:hypothetical protein